MRACACSIMYFCHLRPTVDAQGAHPVHAHVAHVHTLGIDLHAAALEVLLIVDAHLTDRWGWRRQRDDEPMRFSPEKMQCDRMEASEQEAAEITHVVQWQPSSQKLHTFFCQSLLWPYCYGALKKQQIVAADVSSGGKVLDSLHPHRLQSISEAALVVSIKQTNCSVVVVAAAYLVGHHAHLRSLALSSFPISLGSSLGLLSSSRHDWDPEKRSCSHPHYNLCHFNEKRVHRARTNVHLESKYPKRK